jgi:hypothetical protein
MPNRNTTTQISHDKDKDLALIDAFEAAIVAAHDERHAMAGAAAAEVTAQRPAVVALAKAVTDRMRAEYLQRSHRA